MTHRMLKNSGTETEPQEWNSECWDDVHLLRGVQNAVVDAFYSDYLIGTVAFADRSLQGNGEANAAMRQRDLRRGEGEV